MQNKVNHLVKCRNTHAVSVPSFTPSTSVWASATIQSKWSSLFWLFYLVIFYIRKLTGAALPISARDMDDGERKYYGKQK